MTKSITIPSRESIVKRKQLLTNLVHQKEEALRNAPRGSLRISCSGKRVQYYRRLDPKDKNGVYLKKSEQDTIERLAQKHYDKLVLKAAKKELKANRVTLGVFANNPKAQVCYEAVGFKPFSKRIMKILGTDWECIDMELNLQ